MKASSATWRHRPTMTAREVARVTGLPERSVENLIAEGKLGTVTLDGVRLVYVEDLLRLLERRDPMAARVRTHASRLHSRIRGA